MRLLCLILCVATWRGPMPCLHEHLAGSPISESDSNLGAHCAQCHFDVDQVEHLGWHFHVLMPWAESDPTENAGETAADPVVRCEVLPSISVAPLLDLLIQWEVELPAGLNLASLNETAKLCSSVAPQSSFLNSLLQAVSLRAVTGVALC